MTIMIHQASLFLSIQDAGRTGYQRFGMPESGPMDWWAFRGANRLVGNDPGRACLEIGFSDAEVSIERRSLLAVAGAGCRVFVNAREQPLWMAFITRPGDRVQIQKTSGGNWTYLAVAGGVQSPLWMGSRSTFPAAGIGQKIAEGDRLPLSASPGEPATLAGQALPQTKRPDYAQDLSLRVIPGPHQDRFTSESRERLWASSYSLSIQSDRMGYRLDGAPLSHIKGADLVSQGMVLGEIQVPGDGQPIVMMPDHPTTGGYTCIGTVARVDLPLLAQLEPGAGRLRFVPCEVDEALALWAAAIEMIDTGSQLEEDVWLNL